VINVYDVLGRSTIVGRSSVLLWSFFTPHSNLPGDRNS